MEMVDGGVSRNIVLNSSEMTDGSRRTGSEPVNTLLKHPVIRVFFIKLKAWTDVFVYEAKCEVGAFLFNSYFSKIISNLARWPPPLRCHWCPNTLDKHV